jgi:uncharacterized protein with NRDE domain
MCTVSFIPLNKDQFILTSNRDESTARGLASMPEIKFLNDQQILLPVDPLGKGSWIAVSNSGWMCCLLNGAFERHHHQPPYRNSRGLVVLDFFSYHDERKFCEQYSLDGIEPFTLVMASVFPQKKLLELRWDGMKKYVQLCSIDQIHVWSSATLYSEKVHHEKEKKFVDAAKKITSPSPETLIDLHSQFKYEDWVKGSDRVHQVATLSTTSVLASPSYFEMHYKDWTAPGTEPKVKRVSLR